MDGNFPGRMFSLTSMYNERAGPRDWFSNRPSLTRSSGMNTPDYAQATNLYPHMARQDDADYRYRPSNATVIPVVHMVSNSAAGRVDSPSGSSTSSLERNMNTGSWSSQQQALPQQQQQQQQQSFVSWTPGTSATSAGEIQSPSNTLRSTSSASGGYASSIASSISSSSIARGSAGGSTGGPMAYQIGSIGGLTESRSPSTSTASSSGKTDTEAEVDALTSLLLRSMEPKMGIGGTAGSPGFKKPGSTYGVLKPVGPRGKTSPQQLATAANTVDVECFRCRRRLQGVGSGGGIRVGALNTYFHTSCFTCYRCSSPLNQDAFFHAHKRLLCPRCVSEALESCANCDRPVTERVIRALGRPYHPKCFTCSVCHCRLDGKPFTVDVHNRIHCLEDFHKRYAPRCTACGRPITPQAGGKQETKRVVANDSNYHLECFGMREVV